jgi:hypothetical protein
MRVRASGGGRRDVGEGWVWVMVFPALRHIKGLPCVYARLEPGKN